MLEDLNGMNLGMSAATEVKAYFVNTMIIQNNKVVIEGWYQENTEGTIQVTKLDSEA